MEEKNFEMSIEELAQGIGGCETVKDLHELNQASLRALQHWAREYKKQGRTKEELKENTRSQSAFWSEKVDQFWNEAPDHD